MGMRRSRLIRKVLDFVNFEHEVDDFDKIHEAIEKDLIFRGSTIWILMFATILASVGLNMNSTAVIIGAMLISPLMGPINGMGYSIATYNFPLLRKAIKNFLFAVFASLIASTAYFSLSPISTAHSELLARTSPTIYDVIIALFGGLAGIVAISSKQKGNVIPGVAIATALMPPLCTAGYGLATGQHSYFFGAIYLFTINAVFIAISSVIVSQILKFPIRTLVDKEKKKKINRIISIITILVMIPSIHFGYILIQKEKFIEKATKYVNNISVVEGNYLLKNEIRPKNRSILLVYGGASLTDTQKMNIVEKAKDFSLDDVKIEFIQGFSFDQITKKDSEFRDLKTEINRLTMLVQEKDRQLDSIKSRSYLGLEILDEIRNLYPQIINCSYAESFVFYDAKSNPDKLEIVVFTTKGQYLKPSEKKKIENWLKRKLKSDKVKVNYEN
jgi:uncharacterized hydrophobic protein (TIGR00271 family)